MRARTQTAPGLHLLLFLLYPIGRPQVKAEPARPRTLTPTKTRRNRRKSQRNADTARVIPAGAAPDLNRKVGIEDRWTPLSPCALRCVAGRKIKRAAAIDPMRELSEPNGFLMLHTTSSGVFATF